MTGVIGYAFRQDFESSDTQVFQGRWGTIFATIAALLPLEGALRQLWSLELFTMGNAAGQQRGDDGSSADISIVTKAKRSAIFWSYTMFRRPGLV